MTIPFMGRPEIYFTWFIIQLVSGLMIVAKTAAIDDNTTALGCILSLSSMILLPFIFMAIGDRPTKKPKEIKV